MFAPLLEKYRDRDMKNKGLRRDAQRAEKDDVVPTREKMRVSTHRRIFSGSTHQIRRWIGNQVGRLWDTVHSELCALTPKNSLERIHLMECVENMVYVAVEETDGVLYDLGGSRRWKLQAGDFYVRNGVLCRLAHQTKAVKPDPEKAVTFTGQMEGVGQSNGQWFAVTFTEYTKVVGVWGYEKGKHDVFLRKTVGEWDCLMAYGKYIVAVSKRAMSKREIKKFKAAR